MKTLVLGSGGREHALAWAISRSPKKPEVITSPGNAGTELLGVNIDLDLGDHAEIIEFCHGNKIDLVVVGPEAPLVDGIADILRENNILVFGPGSAGAQLEGSKIFAKEFCRRNGIATASYKVFSEAKPAHKYIDTRMIETCVVKADGLAAGKGAIVCDDSIDAHSAVDTILVEKKFGDAGDRIIIEERLAGFETTLLTIVSGSKYVKLPYSQDHKRAYDGDKGPNTGGMGVFAPTPKITKELDERITAEIVEPTIQGLLSEGISYSGCLYFGLIVTEEGPNLIEYNCRFGDPEAQAVLPLMEGDFCKALESAARGSIGEFELTQSDKKALTVILASKGYPEKYRKGVDITDDIEILENNPELIVFHAGTTKFSDRLVTNGGRVVAITALGDDFRECRDRLYRAIDKLTLKGIIFRTDIGSELVVV